MIRVTMLGPARFWYGNHLIDLSPLERQIHIVLWLAGGTLSMQELAAEIWSVPSPGSASTLRGYLSRSRKKAVDAGATAADLSETLASRGGKTRIRLPGTWNIDVDQFRRDAQTARDAYDQNQFPSARKLAEATLSLWYDEPLPDAGDGARAKRSREDLLDIHWAMTLTRIKSAICAGGHREVIAELRRLFKERPHEGEVPMILATALYRSDRVPEAAKVCEQAIRSREGKGIEAKRLQVLQQQILNGTAPDSGALGW
jgi:DNA-binding SARP family transcriptional activator